MISGQDGFPPPTAICILCTVPLVPPSPGLSSRLEQYDTISVILISVRPTQTTILAIANNKDAKSQQGELFDFKKKKTGAAGCLLSEMLVNDDSVTLLLWFYLCGIFPAPFILFIDSSTLVVIILEYLRE